MMFLWLPQMIRFMRDASENSAYHTVLAGRISKHLPGSAHVCDAGCGLGYLSLALSQHCGRVSAVDIAPQALDVLKHNIRRFRRGNICVLEGDIAACAPNRPYDAMVFCLFGHAEEVLKIAKTQCAGRVILIRKNRDAGGFSWGGPPSEGATLADAQTALRDWGTPFKSEAIALELGQPFRSLGDAAEFFRTYSETRKPWSMTKDDFMNRLIPWAGTGFSWYLPWPKQLEMLVLEAGDIPDDIVNNT